MSTPTTPRIRVGLGLVVMVLTSAGAIWWIDRDANDPGPYSTFARSSLVELASGHELLLPASLPEGLDPQSSTSDFAGHVNVDGHEFSGDDIIFVLSRVIASTDDGPRIARSAYRSKLLGWPRTGRYEVHQFPDDATRPDSCRSDEPDRIVRSVEGITVVICSADMAPGSPAHEYWSTVPFTADLAAVPWLRGKASPWGTP